MTKARLWRITKDELGFLEPDSEEVQRFPFTYEETINLRDHCKQNGWRVIVEEKLKEWIRNETASRTWPFETIPQNSALGKALGERSFQRKGIQFLKAHRNCLLADEPGLGKTLQAMTAVVESNCTGSILVVAPKTAVFVTWPEQLKTWIHEVAPYDEWIIIGGEMTKLERIRATKQALRWDMGKKRIGPRQWIILSPNYLRIKPKLDNNKNYMYDEDGEKILRPIREAIIPLLALDYAAVIVDEAHLTLSGAVADPKKQSAQRQGLGLLEVQHGGMRIAMSGTPFRGKHENLWGILNWLYPKNFSSYWQWVDKHFNIYVDPLTNARVVGELKDPESLSKELEFTMIRRTKGEVAKELPRKRYGGTPLIMPTGKPGPIAVWLDMYGQQKKAYQSMAEQAIAELEGGQLRAEGVLAEMIRLKQFANSSGFMGGIGEFFPTFPSNKFDWIVDFLAERGIDGTKDPGITKVIIASQFTKHLDLFDRQLNEKLHIPTFKITGAVSANKRVEMQEQWQNNKMPDGSPAPDVFLLNTKAGGQSITLDIADEAVLIDSTFNHEDQEQVEDRIHRISRMHNVTIWNLASRNSIDESILRQSWVMEKSIKTILDGPRGVEFFKQLLSASL